MRKGILFLALTLSFSSLGWAQSFTLDWFKIAGGGGTSTGSVYSVSGIVGQPDAGTMTGNGFSLDGGFWSVFAIQTLSAPLLSLARVDENVVLYWPASAVGYGLEQSQGLVASNGWSAVVPAPFQQNGVHYVTNPIVTGTHFYRLRHP